MSEVGERNDYGLTRADRYRILTSYRTIAMVGLSSNYYNASSFAAIYLDANGYDIVPVNPAQAGKREILGRRVYADLHEAAAGHGRPIEIVDVFRPAHEAPAIARQAIEIGARVLWLQLGVVSDEAAQLAREAGLDVVMDRCCKIEHARFFGGLRTIGLNTGIVTSRLVMRPAEEDDQARRPPSRSAGPLPASSAASSSEYRA
jgi:predicted CoA-binding protein